MSGSFLKNRPIRVKIHPFLLLPIFALVILIMILLNKSQFYSNMENRITKEIILLKYRIENREKFDNIKEIKIFKNSTKYILTIKNPIEKRVNFLSLGEDERFNELYLINYKIEEYSKNNYRLKEIKTKIFPDTQDSLPVKINKNDIDTIKYKIDKINNDFYLEIDKFRSRYESTNIKNIKKINSHLKSSNLPQNIKDQIYSVFNDENNLKNIPEFIYDLIDSMKLFKNTESTYNSTITFLEKIYNESLKIDKTDIYNLYDSIYNYKLYFDNLEIVYFTYLNLEEQL